jgi:integrase
MRKSQLQAVRLRDLDLDRGAVFFRVWKSDTEDLLPLSPELRTKPHRGLTDYERKVRRHHHPGLRPSDYLIPAHSPRRYAPA